MTTNINKVLFSILLLILFTCNKKQEDKFKLNGKSIEVIQNNVECLKVFKDKLDLTDKKIKSIKYLEGHMNRFIKELEKEEFTTFTFFNYYNSGETMYSKSWLIGKYDENNTKLYSFDKDENRIKVEKLKKEKIDIIDGLDNRVSNQNQLTSSYLLVFKFEKSDTCKCMFYENIPFSTISKIIK